MQAWQTYAMQVACHGSRHDKLQHQDNDTSTI
uniref:Uncharacterized protein n=1 Tax=Anguilla anguilla TaxID=7936 RepID=A0A0E9PUX5_ANGAN